MDIAPAIRALANERRLQILEWLKDPARALPAAGDGDLVKDGVCGVFIAEKLGVSQPTASEHLKVLSQAGLLRVQEGQAVDVLQARRGPHQGNQESHRGEHLARRNPRSPAAGRPARPLP